MPAGPAAIIFTSTTRSWGSATALNSRSGNGAGTPLLVYPNPLTAETAVQFTLPAAGPIKLRLSDLLGRLVLPAARTTGRAGTQTLPLLSAATPRPAPGIYLAERRPATHRRTSKVVIP